jgi:hypothetical protein
MSNVKIIYASRMHRFKLIRKQLRLLERIAMAEIMEGHTELLPNFLLSYSP